MLSISVHCTPSVPQYLPLSRYAWPDPTRTGQTANIIFKKQGVCSRDLFELFTLADWPVESSFVLLGRIISDSGSLVSPGFWGCQSTSTSETFD